MIAARLYHGTSGFEGPVGNAFTILCNGTVAEVNYNLSGGSYYFYFLSGVDNTHVTGNMWS